MIKIEIADAPVTRTSKAGAPYTLQRGYLYGAGKYPLPFDFFLPRDRAAGFPAGMYELDTQKSMGVKDGRLVVDEVVLVPLTQQGQQKASGG